MTSTALVFGALTNPALSEEATLEERYCEASNPLTTEDRLTILGMDDVWIIRTMVARNERTNRMMLDDLCHDEHLSVVMAAASNPMASKSALRYLAEEHRSPGVREIAQHNLESML